jgi:hypothetical protein
MGACHVSAALEFPGLFFLFPEPMSARHVSQACSHGNKTLNPTPSLNPKT